MKSEEEFSFPLGGVVRQNKDTDGWVEIPLLEVDEEEQEKERLPG